MAFAWDRMDRTPEGRMGKEQLRRRGDMNTIEELAADYAKQAKDVLFGKDAMIARDEVGRFAKKISSERGSDQYEYLQDLVAALGRRKSSFFDAIPDDEHERAAFGLALVHVYEKSLQ